MGRNPKIDANGFNAIKCMVKGGAKYKEVRDVFGISEFTVSMIANAETLDEYKEKIRKRDEAKKARAKTKQEEVKEKKEDHPAPVPLPDRQTIIVQASHYMLEEQKKTNELLTLISRKLAFIVDELTK